MYTTETNSKNFFYNWWKNVDQATVLSVLILNFISIILVATASPAVASKIGLDSNHFISRQVGYISVAIIIILSFSLFSKNLIKRISILGFLLNIFFLVLVKIYGFEVKGAKRWLNLYGFTMQPSEFIKPFFIIVTAWILSIKYIEKTFPSFTLSLICYLIISILIIIQPDLGMLITITAVWGVQLFTAGMPFIWIIMSSLLGILGLISAYIFLPHVAKRINSFLDPENNENYQVSKSILAFENGGFYGKGPGEGTVKNVLPDSHTDFIFAVAGEEFGAIACIIICFLFAFIVIRGIYKIIDEKDRFILLAVVGILSQIAIQSSINIGVTLNLLPTKGMTLPLISYGGSSTLAIAISMGILISFTQTTPDIKKYRINNSEVIF